LRIGRATPYYISESGARSRNLAPMGRQHAAIEEIAGEGEAVEDIARRVRAKQSE